MLATNALFTFALTAVAAMAQENAPAGLLHGDLVSWTGTIRNGEFTFQAAPDRLYSCSFDDKTYIELEGQRITMVRTARGDRMEVVSDSRQGSNLCYARTVHILETPATYTVPGVRPRSRNANTASLLIPHGNLTFNGVVLRVTPGLLVLKLRSGERKFLRLRTDTHYLADGQMSDPGSLRANTLVFIRAGRNLDDEVEAYQVVWGEILQPE